MLKIWFVSSVYKLLVFLGLALDFVTDDGFFDMFGHILSILCNIVVPYYCLQMVNIDHPVKAPNYSVIVVFNK